MSLQEFDQAEGEPGHLYELGRGEIVVVNVPNPEHFALVDAVRQLLSDYRQANAGRIFCLGAGSECKILLAELESERHPDLAVYKTQPPEEDVWSSWVPEIVIEVVSSGSEERDYVEKREEYLRFGVSEYWILDGFKQELLVLRRSGGRWAERVVRPPEVYRTRLLPGFELACGQVFEAAGPTQA
jgi:Uma2 family endonuclease